MTEDKNLPISWEEFHRHSKALAWRLLESGAWKGIIAVTRGGLVPAAIMARELDVRLIETLCISSYDHQDQRKLNVLKNASDDIGDGEGWLVVDDLADTGNTAKVVRKLLPKAHIATVYVKPEGIPTVDSYIMEVSQDTWIHFPWDVELQFARPIAEQKKII